MFDKSNHEYLAWQYDNQKLRIIPWGQGLRVQATKMQFIDEDWALTQNVDTKKVTVDFGENESAITNGEIKAVVDQYGKITFFDISGHQLLQEYWRVRKRAKKAKKDGDLTVDTNMVNQFVSALKIEGRTLTPNPNGDYRAEVRFESDHDEKIFGMGQYQQKDLDLKYCTLELAHRNSQASVPFAISNKGYGFLWNNPAIGQVNFAKNVTEWIADDTRSIDYWICAGATPKEITEKYTEVTGRPPMMPDYGLGLWQSKLRYQTQDELLSVAREYKKRHLPLSVIVIDYFHWPKQGDFRFDKRYWPNPKAMVEELNKMGVKLMVSVWPTIDEKSENYDEMLSKGLLVQSDRGPRVSMKFQGNTIFYDATNPEARKFVWEKAKKNYYDNGIHIFWLDEAEPEYSPYDFDLYRLYKGRNLSVGNIYPEMFAKTFYDGMQANSQKNIVNLVRSAWAGSQKYGTLVWSGDIDSSFRSLKNQYQAGLNMGMAGISWWTTDIGGFHGGVITDEKFRELLVRWFEFATFSPVLRMHGDREPHTAPLGSDGGGSVKSGAGNELWSYGDKVYDILNDFLKLRGQLSEYIRSLYDEAHRLGYPLMRTLYYEFPNDSYGSQIENQHMFGHDLLVAPIFEYGQRERSVYLPQNEHWQNAYTGEIYDGGQKLNVKAPLNQIPVFIRVGSNLNDKFGGNDNV